MSESLEGDDAAPRFFIAGATGYTGQSLVHVARSLDVDVIAHIRPGSPRRTSLMPAFHDLGAEVDLSPWSDVELTKSLKAHRPTHVFALLGTTSKRGRAAARKGQPLEDYQSIDYGLTAMLLRATQACCPPPVFIYLSARGVSPKSRFPYMVARAQLEAELRASGVPHLIARPGFISGPDREEWRPGERMVSVISDTVLATAKLFGGRRIYESHASLTGGELARGLCGAALQLEASAQDLDILALRRCGDALPDREPG